MKTIDQQVQRRPHFDPEVFEREAMAGLQPFQRATVEQIDAMFRNKEHPMRRILVADEVGLGKTRVARGVVGKMARLRWEENDDLFKVAYVCGSQNIVRQNLGKLAPGFKDIPEEGRLSMQHLFVAEGDAKRKRNGEFVQLIPITPETSFRLDGKPGTWQERALIAAVVGGMPEFSRRRGALERRLRGTSGESLWAGRVKNARKRVQDAREADPDGRYPENVWTELKKKDVPNPDEPGETIPFEGFVERMLEKPGGAKFAKEIGILRRRFAEISAELLEPDLVILDEFQRFRYLIEARDGGDGGEVKVLFDRFLREGNGSEKEQPRVLMLSATPFKLYSTKEERGKAGEEESFREFKGVVDFLFDVREGEKVWEKWREYTEAMAESDFAEGKEGEAGLLEKKSRAERKLRRGICRTERGLAGENGGIGASGVAEMVPETGEIREYVQYAEWTRAMGLGEGKGWRLPVDYVKSVPYVLSFLDGDYKEKRALKREMEGRGRELASKTSREAKEALWLDKRKVKAYRKIAPANARLALLEEQAFAGGAERLLWVPPTVPYYGLEGAFAGSKGYSKTLVFSQWRMVPKMAATMVSYEAERRTVAKVAKKKAYDAKTRIAGRLEFRMGKGGASAMSLFALLYPSRTLAEAFSAVEALNEKWGGAREAAKRVKGTLRERLASAKLPNPKEGREDARWYYLAPMLLDGREEALEWVRNARGIFPKDEGQAVQRHFDILERELKGGRRELGRRPADLTDVLADMALGSPAVCLRRTGFDVPCCTLVADAFLRFLNTPEAIAAVACAYGHNKKRKDHWRTVLAYGRDGCLQAVLDEYAHLLEPDVQERGKQVADEMKSALEFRTTTYLVDTFEALRDWAAKGEWFRMRSHFAAAFAEGEGDEKKGVQRRESLRTAFNSPFRPFVLVSTSIGQEGLDFHQYCRKVFHWNLPHNPLDLEQREGRVDRWRGLAVRQNVAERFMGEVAFRENVWQELFNAAEEAARQEGKWSGLVPNWRNGGKAKWGVERIVPLHVCGEDEGKHEWLMEILRRFRMAIGQPRQEELLAKLEKSGMGMERVKRLFLNLCPFGEGKEKDH